MADFYDTDLVKSFEMTDDFVKKAQSAIDANKTNVPPFWQNKYKKEVVKNWDAFYRRNTTNFFKDRKWLSREFRELEFLELPIQDSKDEASAPFLLDVGCGVGNAVFPILQKNLGLRCVAVDCSSRAIEFLKQRWEEVADENHARLSAHVCDVSLASIPQEICEIGIADFSLLLFVLSALPKECHIDIAKRVSEKMKPGGILMFRDYGKYDMAQVRFANRQESRVDENLYVRQDGTLAYYFTTEEIRYLFESAGFVEKENMYVLREFWNRKRDIKMRRVWIQAKFEKV